MFVYTRIWNTSTKTASFDCLCSYYLTNGNPAARIAARASYSGLKPSPALQPSSKPPPVAHFRPHYESGSVDLMFPKENSSP